MQHLTHISARRRRLSAFLLGLLILLPLKLSAQWEKDILPGYSASTIPLRSDSRGALVATLVRHDSLVGAPRALLYVHGYNDYFFQQALGDSITHHGIAFYALDLRRYGRSLRPHQDAFATTNLREYYEELGKALKQIRQEGAKEVYLMAHSTGGLITSLYLHDTRNSDSIAGFILNSPFLDFNFSPAQERYIVPLLAGVGKALPSKVISGISREPDLYAQSLLKRYHGKWDFDTNWKKDHGHPIRLGWLRAIRRWHQRVHQGLDLHMPILLMSSDKSLRASGAWQPAYAEADLVLDVEDIQRYGQRLGDRIQAVRIPGGLHDLFLSTDSTAYQQAYQQLFTFLDALAR